MLCIILRGDSPESGRDHVLGSRSRFAASCDESVRAEVDALADDLADDLKILQVSMWPASPLARTLCTNLSHHARRACFVSHELMHVLYAYTCDRRELAEDFQYNYILPEYSQYLKNLRRLAFPTPHPAGSITPAAQRGKRGVQQRRKEVGRALDTSGLYWTERH